MRTSNLEQIEPFITKDGSSIREIATPAFTPAQNQSLAEALVPAGGKTDRHYHVESEEIYFVTSGGGTMELEDVEFEFVTGDCVVIPPGTPHQVSANAGEDLVFLCMCSPAYSHEDTVLIDG